MDFDTQDSQQRMQRRQQRAQQRAQQRKLRQQKARVRLFIACAALLATGILIAIIAVQGQENQPPTEVQTVPTQVTVPPTTGPAASQAQTVIHLAAAGDLNVTDRTVASGGDLLYDYSKVFADVSHLLSEADYAVLNFEGNLSGQPYGTQTGSAPTELAQALADMGVDLVQTANSASIRAGLLGLTSTLNTLQTLGLQSLGTYESNADFRSGGGYIIQEVEGIRIGFVAFTKGMDSLGLPDGSENCVNILYEDYSSTYKTVDRQRITGILRSLEDQNPDITVAMVHWGSEHYDSISDTQKEIRSLMLQNGVDVILGTHPHLLHSIEFDEEAGTLVAWSLGDFFGNATEPGSAYSIVLNLEITKDNATGVTRVTGFTYTPIYTIQPKESSTGQLMVMRTEEAIKLYENKFLGAVSKSVYDSMLYSLERVEERIHTPVE